MAKWIEKGSGGSLMGGIEYESGQGKGTSNWQIYQDEKPFLEQAKRDRESTKKRDVGYKKFATIPDIVALEIKEKYHIDIHNADHSSDKATMARFMKLIKQDYPYLLSY
jgi:hypothetical protein